MYRHNNDSHILTVATISIIQVHICDKLQLFSLHSQTAGLHLTFTSEAISSVALPALAHEASHGVCTICIPAAVVSTPLTLINIYMTVLSILIFSKRFSRDNIIQFQQRIQCITITCWKPITRAAPFIPLCIHLTT